MESSLFAAIAAVFFLAGLVKGVIGLGLPTVAIGLLSMLVPPGEAAALLLLPSLLTNVAQMLGPRWSALARRMAPLLAGILVGSGLGALVWSGQGGAVALASLGAALVAYALYGVVAPRLRCPPRLERPLALAAGVATGVLTAGTGVFVLPAVPFLQSLSLDRDELVRAMGIAFTVSTLGLGATLFWSGEASAGSVLPSLLALAPTLAGMWAGARLRGRVGGAAFRRLFFLGLGAVGLHLLLRGVGAA